MNITINHGRGTRLEVDRTLKTLKLRIYLFKHSPQYQAIFYYNQIPREIRDTEIKLSPRKIFFKTCRLFKMKINKFLVTAGPPLTPLIT